MTDPVFFINASSFRDWLEKNHACADSLVVGFYKVGSSQYNMSWSESVDEALCYGWIDGVRRSVDKERYCVRFTPRRPNSIWSAVNINKMEALVREGRMTPAGLSVFQNRKPEKSGIYSFENKEKALPEELELLFRKHEKAWDFFQSLSPSYKKTSLHWITSAKQETTRLKRLQTLIEESSKGQNPWKNNPYNKK
jgi:uncharacterized protein YdeI (YjbR/CyaY-like superfamily)